MAKYTQGYAVVFDVAAGIQKKFNLSYIGTEVILYAILNIPKCDACQYLNKFGATKENYFAPLKHTLKQRNVTGFTAKAVRAQKNAAQEASKYKLSYVSTEHLLLGIIAIEDCKAMSILRSLGVDISKLYSYISDRIKQKIKSIEQPVATNTEINEEVKNQETKFNFNELNEPIKSERYSETPSKLVRNPLFGLGYDLTEKAKNGGIDPVIGREEETARIIQTLSRKTKNSPVLIGEAGVGKTAVVEGLALKIANGEAPEFLRDKIIFSLDLAGALSGTRYRGDFEERVKAAVDYAISEKNYILFIDEIHNLVGAGSTNEGKFDLAELLKPILARGELSVIGATTTEEYVKYIEKDAALDRRFQPVKIEEPSIETAITILKGIKPAYEAHHKITISDEAIEAAVKLSDRYVTGRYLPDKAIDLIDEAASKKHVEITSTPKNILKLEEKVKSLIAERDYALNSKNLDKARKADSDISDNIEKIRLEKVKLYKKRSEQDPAVSVDDVKELISLWTKIPVSDLSSEDKAKLISLEDDLVKKVVGQFDAIVAVSRAVRRSRANVNDPTRPIGAFLFVGPTGVGKTELAKALSECVFGDKNSLIRFDMSEYQDKTAINKLIGSAPGYVGYEQEGLLTEKVRNNPYSVVLFDEIEKASSEIYDVLLQIMGEGRLTDNKGRLVSFKNTIIILTSNEGYSLNRSLSFGFGGSQEENDVIEAVKRRFKPEFINRLDDVIVFNHLSENDCYDVADILINQLIKRLNAEGYKLFVENSAMEQIVKEGYSKEYGARNLKRVISKRIEDLLSDAIILGDVVRGDKITVLSEDGSITYKKG